MVARPALHQTATTWASLIAAGAIVCGFIFTAGDANQRLASDGQRLDKAEIRIDGHDRDLNEMRVTLATMAAQMNDVQVTVHRVDGSPVPAR